MNKTLTKIFADVWETIDDIHLPQTVYKGPMYEVSAKEKHTKHEHEKRPT